MNDSKNKFYETYWQDTEDAIPTKDPTIQKRLKFIFNTLEKNTSIRKILDAGCGSGVFTSALAKAGYEAIGMDISETAIQKVSRKHKNIEFYHGALDNQWPFENSSFDAILSTEVIEHVFGTHEMITEINRVLKPGGLLILTTPYHGFIKNLAIIIFGFDRHFNNIKGGHIRFFTKKSLIGILRQSGFEPIETRYIGRIKPVAKSIYLVGRKSRNI